VVALDLSESDDVRTRQAGEPDEPAERVVESPPMTGGPRSGSPAMSMSWPTCSTTTSWQLLLA
jgi:hypothetical protein